MIQVLMEDSLRQKSSPEAGIAKLKPTRRKVLESLQTMILRGECASGTPLRQLRLATHFGVAQGLIREVLLELRLHGLVDGVDNRGAIVGKVDREILIESLEIREMHEALAVRRCCERASRVDVDKLIDLAREIRDRGDARQLDEMCALDRLLHSRLIELSEGHMLARLADNYKIFERMAQVKRNPDIEYDEHLAILQAIREGRSDDAEQCVRQHIVAIKHELEAQPQRDSKASMGQP
jgi:DNA-binding GntR family transcriptional regulator